MPSVAPAWLMGLDEIAGMGHRKALEFLIKDHAKYKRPDDSARVGQTDS
jgi:hypothetical protein